MSARHHGSTARMGGFTLLELMVVISIIALASVMVSLAIRDPAQDQLEREALRLDALLEAARAQSRATGNNVRWQATPTGFVFTGLPGQTQVQVWLDPQTRVRGNTSLSLGPEPILAPQFVLLYRADGAGQTLRLASDGLRPFSILPDGTQEQAQ